MRVNFPKGIAFCAVIRKDPGTIEVIQNTNNELVSVLENELMTHNLFYFTKLDGFPFLPNQKEGTNKCSGLKELKATMREKKKSVARLQWDSGVNKKSFVYHTAEWNRQTLLNKATPAMFSSYKPSTVYKTHFIKLNPVSRTVCIHREGNHFTFKQPRECKYLEEARCCAISDIKCNTLYNVCAVPQWKAAVQWDSC